MRRVKPVLAAVGLVVIGWFVYRIGLAPILETLQRLQWWQLFLVCVPYALIMAVDTLGWRFAFVRARAPFMMLYGARLAGEALNVVTALGSMGGEAVKAWLIRRDVAYDESVPAVVIAKTTTTIAQTLFLLIGVVLAWAVLALDPRVLTGMLWLLVVQVAAVAGFVWVQLAGVVATGGRILARLGMPVDVASARGLDAALRTFYRQQWRRFALSTGFHLAGWLLGAGEALLMLYFLGIPLTVVGATVVEALGAGVRFATFLVPASLGAFEGANAAAFEVMGLGAGAGLAFSFIRRARQLVWIGVGILVLVAMAPSAKGPHATRGWRPAIRRRSRRELSPPRSGAA
jgi:uncharacterized membrane protein YbhN (UPF0104 family)